MTDTDVNGEYWLQEDDPREILACFDANVQSRDGAHVVELCREIVKAHGAQLIDGVVVDVQSANIIVTTYDGLSEKNRATFVARRSVESMGALAWNVICRAKTRGQQPV